jgi:hypothetical protein
MAAHSVIARTPDLRSDGVGDCDAGSPAQTPLIVLEASVEQNNWLSQGCHREKESNQMWRQKEAWLP